MASKKYTFELSEEEMDKPFPDTFIGKGGSAFEIDEGYLKQCNVFFATPCYAGMLTDQYFLSMIRVSQKLTQIGAKFRITTTRNESLVTRARNILTATFLDSNCTHLFFIDADIEFEPDSVLRMLALDREIIAGACPKKTLPAEYAVHYKVTDPAKNTINFEKGAVELEDAGTGFLCIKREVIEKMVKAHPELHYTNDSSIDPKLNPHCYALFDTFIDPASKRYLSEYYYFCRLARELGIRIWLDPQTSLNHVGTHTFKGEARQVRKMGE